VLLLFRHFAKYIDEGLDADSLEDLYTKVGQGRDGPVRGGGPRPEQHRRCSRYSYLCLGGHMPGGMHSTCKPRQDTLSWAEGAG
jgi:hypothetical protein